MSLSDLKRGGLWCQILVLDIGKASSIFLPAPPLICIMSPEYHGLYVYISSTYVCLLSSSIRDVVQSFGEMRFLKSIQDKSGEGVLRHFGDSRWRKGAGVRPS